MTTDALPRQSNGFQHDAFVYDDDDEYASVTRTFLDDGLAADDRMLVVVAADKIAALRSELGTDADGIQFADMHELGANPARILPAWSDFLADSVRLGRGARGVGEPIWSGRSPAELAECHVHEALLNYAFGRPAEPTAERTVPFRLLCPYDARSLPPDVIDEARTTHPWICEAGERRPSPWTQSGESYDPYGISRRFAAPLPAPTEVPEQVSFDARSVGALRCWVEARAERAGLDDRRADVTLAVYEVATNSVQHGGGRGVLRAWNEDAGSDRPVLVCEIEDGGRIEDPLAGRVRPNTRAASGRGLWIANQLCDLVQVRTSPTGSTVRIHMRVNRTPPPHR